MLPQQAERQGSEMLALLVAVFVEELFETFVGLIYTFKNILFLALAIRLLRGVDQ